MLSSLWFALIAVLALGVCIWLVEMAFPTQAATAKRIGEVVLVLVFLTVVARHYHVLGG